MRILVTGGLGFIGSAVVRRLIEHTDHTVLNVDAVTYAATTGSVASVAENERYSFAQVDIADGDALRSAFDAFQPDAVMHLAAETHVDRSIDDPGTFIRTNVTGTYELLRASLRAAEGRRSGDPEFRFLHVSTDEVFGALGFDDAPFDESTRYDPRSPYSASKAAADHLARAWCETYGLPTIVTNCSNNYGPFHFPEKLIPLMILKAWAGESLPVYGKGENIRDWLFVDDHARGLVAALEQGAPGETYVFGGNAERSNLEVVHSICDLLDDVAGTLDGPRRELISFVDDRPGHDLRYAVSSERARADLAWEPSVSFDSGLEATVRWYLDNREWWAPLASERYSGQRLGMAVSNG